MKKTISIFITAVLMLTLVLGLTTVAQAGDSLSTSVKIVPPSLAGEGNVSVSVTIKNNGDPITGVQLKYPSPTDTVVDLGSMPTGDSKTHNNDEWHISADMLNTDLAFTVLWTSSDGTRKSGNTQSFQIARQQQIIRVSGSATADRGEVEIGERVKFTFTFKNEGNTTLENCRLNAPNIDSGAQIGDSFSLPPGSVNNKTYTVAINESLNVTPTYTYEVNGQQYTYKINPLNIVAKDPPKTIAMGVTLNAGKSSVAAGDNVVFTVKVVNTGTSALDGLSAVDFEGNTVPMVPASLQPGETASGTASLSIPKTDNYEFTVSGIGAGGERQTQKSNAVHIIADGEATSDDEIIDPSQVVDTKVQISATQLDGPGEVTVIATVTNLTSKDLSNVLVINELAGTIGTTDLLTGGDSKTFEKTFTVEETGEYAFVTTAELPDGTLIESKTNAATITVGEGDPGGSSTMWLVIILVAIAAVGILLVVYIVRSRKKIKERDAAMAEESADRKEAIDRMLEEDDVEQSTQYHHLRKEHRTGGSRPSYPDRTAYTRRKTTPLPETFDKKEAKVGKKPKVTFEDRNKF